MSLTRWWNTCNNVSTILFSSAEKSFKNNELEVIHKCQRNIECMYKIKIDLMKMKSKKHTIAKLQFSKSLVTFLLCDKMDGGLGGQETMISLAVASCWSNI